MGNQQSNENTRKRMVYVEPKIKKDAKLISCEVLRKEKHEGCNFIRFYLDKYVTYKDGNYKYINCINNSPFNHEYAELIFQKLDLNYIKNYNSTETFENYWDVVGATGGGFEERDNYSGNSQWEEGLQENIREIGGAREMLARANEWSDFDKQMQRAWQLQPPKK